MDHCHHGQLPLSPCSTLSFGADTKTRSVPCYLVCPTQTPTQRLRERPNSPRRPRPPRPAHRLEGATTRWSVCASAGYIGASGRSNHHRKWRRMARVRGDTRSSHQVSAALVRGIYRQCTRSPCCARQGILGNLVWRKRAKRGKGWEEGTFGTKRSISQQKDASPRKDAPRFTVGGEFSSDRGEMAVDWTPSQCVS